MGSYRTSYVPLYQSAQRVRPLIPIRHDPGDAPGLSPFVELNPSRVALENAQKHYPPREPLFFETIERQQQDRYKLDQLRNIPATIFPKAPNFTVFTHSWKGLLKLAKNLKLYTNQDQIPEHLSSVDGLLQVHLMKPK